MAQLGNKTNTKYGFLYDSKSSGLALLNIIINPMTPMNEIRNPHIIESNPQHMIKGPLIRKIKLRMKNT